MTRNMREAVERTSEKADGENGGNSRFYTIIQHAATFSSLLYLWQVLLFST